MADGELQSNPALQRFDPLAPAAQRVDAEALHVVAEEPPWTQMPNPRNPASGSTTGMQVPSLVAAALQRLS